MESVGAGVPKGDLLRLRAPGERSARRARAGPRSPCRARESALGEAGKRIEKAFSTFRAEAQRDLNAHEAEIAGLKEVVIAGEDRVRRTEVRSPVRGTIKTLKIGTIGGVVQPGPIWSRSCRSRTRCWSRPRSGRPTSPSWLPGCRRWSRSPPTISRSMAASRAWSRRSAPTRSPTSGTRASTGSACGPTGIIWARRASHLRIIPGMTAQVDVLTGREDGPGLPAQADLEGAAAGRLTER